MNAARIEEFAVPILLGVLLVLATSVQVWIAILGRLVHRKPVVAYQPRTPVPWNGLDILVVLLLYIAFTGLFQIVRGIVVETVPKAPAIEVALPDGEPQAEHPLIVLLRDSHNPVVVVLGLFIAVVVAPVTEEFFFRLLLQGWLEKLEGQWRRLVPAIRRMMRGLLPVLCTSVFFASLHFRTAQPAADPQTLLAAMTLGGVARLLTVGLAIVLIRLRTGATAEDFGLVPAEFRRDFGLGLLAFAAMAVPIYAIQRLLMLVLPKTIAPDPITLVFFAAALGYLYFRTHRIVPSLVLHMALNGTSLALLLLLG